MKKITLALAAMVFVSCASKKSAGTSIAVFAPGVLADSPIYEMMAEGVKEAVDSWNARASSGRRAACVIMEAGTNQAKWSESLKSIAATGKSSVIISSNPSLPEIASPIAREFPGQRFILLDAFSRGDMSIAAVRYNQREQSWLAGYVAALSSKKRKIGLIAAQEYPVMNGVILPGFAEGAKAAGLDGEVDFRVVGNWHDAAKGAELASAMARSNVDVILPIAGGAAQGVVSSARENGCRLVFFDSDVFEKAPDIIAACVCLDQKRMAREAATAYLEGNAWWGETKTVGVKEGYVNLLVSGADEAASADVRAKAAEAVEKIKSGEIFLPQD